MRTLERRSGFYESDFHQWPPLPLPLIGLFIGHFAVHLFSACLAAATGLLGQVGVLPLTGASVCRMKRGETSGRWGEEEGGGGVGGGRGHLTLMTSAGRNPPLDSGSVWKCAWVETGCLVRA